MSRIKGITIEFDGNTTKLESALKKIDGTARKTGTELRQIENVIKFNPRHTEMLAQKQQVLGKRVEETRTKLNALKQAQEQVNEAYKKGDITEEQYRKFQRELAKTESQLKNYERQLYEATNKMHLFGQRAKEIGEDVKKFGDSMTSVGKDLSMKVTAPLVGIGTAATLVGAEFKAGLSEVQAISGATAGDMKLLEERARELGSTTKFSAKEATDGFKYMSMAGWDVKQSLDGIDGFLSLAAASGTDLARVSDILTEQHRSVA